MFTGSVTQKWSGTGNENNPLSNSPPSDNIDDHWMDLEERSKFTLLQTLSDSINPSPSPSPSPAPVRPELKSFCENSDGLGLRQFISLALDQQSILSELPDAYRCSRDAPAMVLDAMVGFYRRGNKGNELRLLKSGCLVMLEGLIRLNPVVVVTVEVKAMAVAVEWNEKRVSDSGPVKAKEQNALGFLLLVGAYGLVDRFSIDDVIDCFVVVAADRHNVHLCRRIIPENNINDMIQKLIDNDMHVTAVNFSIDLQKTDEFPPVGLLEDRKLRSLRVIEEARANVKDLHVYNAVTIKEISTLKSIIECIEENHLQSEYPKDSVVELVIKLENEVENNKQTLVKNLRTRKQPTRAAVLKKHPLLNKCMLKKSKKPRLDKGQPTAESAAATPVQDVKLVKKSCSQKPDLSPDHVDECHNSSLGSGPTGSNGVHVGERHSSPVGSGPTGSNAPCAIPAGSLDGSIRADIGYNFYVKQSQPPSEYNSNGWISD